MKHHKDIILLFTAVIAAVNLSFAHLDSVLTKQLNIGDLCPNFEFSNIVNGPKTSAQLSDFKGKLVILDFWATWCTPCINSIPKMDSLQAVYSERLVILPVTYQQADVVTRFIAGNNKLKNLGLPSITGDTTLFGYFPHITLPHQVWIDESGRVIAFTTANDVNSTNLDSYFQAGKLESKTKAEILEDDTNKPLLLGRFGNAVNFTIDDLYSSSVITKYVEGIPAKSSFAAQDMGDYIKLNGINNRIEWLYEIGFTAGISGQKPWETNFYLKMPARFLIETSHSYLFAKPWDEESKRIYKAIPREEKLFCYERIVPARDSLNINSYMIQDLNEFFGGLLGIEGCIEKRKVTCLALVRTTSSNLIKSKGGEPKLNIDPYGNKQYLSVINMPLRMLMHEVVVFGMPLNPIPIIDDTGYTENVDIELNCDLTTLETLNTGFEKYGLRLEYAMREIDMIVIRDK